MSATLAVIELERANAQLNAELEAGATERMTLRIENSTLRAALLAHRADMHMGSKRPCPTCRQSAEALGLTGKVPDHCARGETDRKALLPPEDSTDGK